MYHFCCCAQYFIAFACFCTFICILCAFVNQFRVCSYLFYRVKLCGTCLWILSGLLAACRTCWWRSACSWKRVGEIQPGLSLCKEKDVVVRHLKSLRGPSCSLSCWARVISSRSMCWKDLDILIDGENSVQIGLLKIDRVDVWERFLMLVSLGLKQHLLDQNHSWRSPSDLL